MNAQLDKLKFDSSGLVPAIVQDHETGQVLALYYMNRDAIEKTIETGKVHTYSRSRGRLALKGETSGHFEFVKSLQTDCDRDALVIKVDQHGGACHEGYYSCFFRQYEPGATDWKIIAEKTFDPDAVYKK
jgi:phosphoribosyl-AMP cyclohydrolase